jgi:hypothetical protein
MQFLLTVTIREHASNPTAALQASMTKFVDDETRTGTLVMTGGLAPEAQGSGIRLSNGGLVRDAPQLRIHGYAVVNSPTLEHATGVASRLLRLHQQLAPDWEVDCDVREIVTHCLP